MSIDPNGQPPQIKPAWHVLRVEDTTSYQAGKGAVRVKRVWWQLWDGSESYTDFPAAGFDPAKVAKSIEAEAATLNQALQLRGEDIQVGGS